MATPQENEKEQVRLLLEDLEKRLPREKFERIKKEVLAHEVH